MLPHLASLLGIDPVTNRPRARRYGDPKVTARVALQADARRRRIGKKKPR